MMQGLDLVVFSHLRWNFVFQRPQQIFSRLAKSSRILFIEEPIPGSQGELHFEIEQPQQGVTVVRPHSPAIEFGFHENQLNVLKSRIAPIVKEAGFRHYGAWFYTPLALPLLAELSPELVVYDSMDALDAFLNAPPLLQSREVELLNRADLVFTGGPSLHRRLKHRHANVHCFSSSVDAKHFGQAKSALVEPVDQAGISHPRLGYFGVIDERIDLPLIDTLARSEPDWQIVVVGPVAKIPMDSLPRHSNLHYLGQKDYAELPSYLSGWDVCLMPFARNESTKHISPTKVLEYMAAEKPIVSTPITDVVEPYGEIVYIADTAQDFIDACRKALSASAEESALRIGAMRKVLSATSWENTVNDMTMLMDRAVQCKASDSKRQSVPRVVESDAAAPPVAIIGAGPTGLSAAYHLGDSARLLEQSSRVGGWCRSVEEQGFTFDFAGHIMFSNDAYVHELYKKLLGDNVHWQDREAWIYSKNVYTRYPFQGALYGLPPEVIKECILGAVEARFGPLKGQPKCATSINGQVNGAVGGGKNGAIPHGDVKDCCGDGVLEASAPLGVKAGSESSVRPAPRNFEEFIYQVWGAGIAKHFAIPYNQKLWAVPLSEMETSWLGGRVPMPDLEEMLEGALQPVAKPMGPNARFGYPLRGGFQALMDGFLPSLKDRLKLNTSVVGISLQRKLLTLNDGTQLSFRHLISTMPLPVLIRLIGDEAPQQIHEAVGKLRHVSVRCVNLGIGRPKLTEKHWIYYPEQTVFHRIFVQGNASPHCNPPGGFGLTCEITYSPHKPLPCDGDALVQRCIQDCRDVGMIDANDPIWVANQVDMPYAYVVYDHARASSVKLIRQWLADRDVSLAGRYSEWEYYNSDHAFIAGKKVAEQVLASLASQSESVGKRGSRMEDATVV